MPEPSELDRRFRTGRNFRPAWITKPPDRCTAGHQLRSGQVLVGHVACRGHGGGHTTWHCTRCSISEPPIYGPPLNTHCTVLAGPARSTDLQRHVTVIEPSGAPARP